MKSIISFCVLLPLISFGDSGYEYTITVSNAKNLVDMDPDVLWITNENDVYVEVYAYGSGDDCNMKMMSTSIIEGSSTPDWNEKFIYNDDEDEDSGGAWTKVMFKLYDDDSTFGSDILNKAGLYIVLHIIYIYDSYIYTYIV